MGEEKKKNKYLSSDERKEVKRREEDGVTGNEKGGTKGIGRKAGKEEKYS